MTKFPSVKSGLADVNRTLIVIQPRPFIDVPQSPNAGAGEGKLGWSRNGMMTPLVNTVASAPTGVGMPETNVVSAPATPDWLAELSAACRYVAKACF